MAKANTFTELFGILEGNNGERDFKHNLKFRLFPPEEGSEYYGTGCYMGVLIDNNTDNEQCIDVRYEKTTNIEELAKRWVNGYYGDRVKSFDTFKVEKDSVGGTHFEGIGYAPNGEYCGECTAATCEGCKIWKDKSNDQ